MTSCLPPSATGIPQQQQLQPERDPTMAIAIVTHIQQHQNADRQSQLLNGIADQQATPTLHIHAGRPQQQEHVECHLHPPAQPFNSADICMMERAEGGHGDGDGDGVDSGCGVCNGLDRECVGVVVDDTVTST